METLTRLAAIGLAAGLAVTARGQAAVSLEYLGRGDWYDADISEAGSVVFKREYLRPDHPWYWPRLVRWTEEAGAELLAIGDWEDLFEPRINSAGQVVFGCYDGNTSPAVRYTDGIGVEILSPPGAEYAISHAINDLGEVTGTLTPRPGARPQVFRFTDGVGMDLLDLQGDYVTAHGWAINEAGDVAGTVEPYSRFRQRAFRYRDGTGIRFLGDLGGEMWVDGMNNRGDVTGRAGVDGEPPYHFYLYSDESGLVDIGGDGYNGQVYDINDARWIVGAEFRYPNTEAVLWTPERGWLVLNSLLPPGTDAELYTALGINNANQIVGNGRIDGQFGIYRLTIRSITVCFP